MTIEAHNQPPMTAESYEDAIAHISSKRAHYPLLIAPWNEYGGADQYVVNSDTELQDAVEKALKDSSHEARVHVIQMSGKRESGIVTQSDN